MVMVCIVGMLQGNHRSGIGMIPSSSPDSSVFVQLGVASNESTQLGLASLYKLLV